MYKIYNQLHKSILKPIQVEVASYLAHENSYDINAWNAGKVLLWSRKRCRLLATRISGIRDLEDISPWYMNYGKLLLRGNRFKEKYCLPIEIEILNEITIRVFHIYPIFDHSVCVEW